MASAPLESNWQFLGKLRVRTLYNCDMSPRKYSHGRPMRSKDTYSKDTYCSIVRYGEKLEAISICNKTEMRNKTWLIDMMEHLAVVRINGLEISLSARIEVKRDLM